MAGLLTFPIAGGLPILKGQWLGDSGNVKRQTNRIGITAAGTVPDLHRIPFSYKAAAAAL